MSAGYVVRGKHKGQHAAISDVDGTSPAERKPNPFATINEAVTRVVWLGPFGWSDVAIFRVLDDGREERLPSYEEALWEIERLREIEGANILNANALRLARENLSTTLGMAPETSMYDLQNEARRRLCADPLATLEAAERRLLEAGGWHLCSTSAGFGVERWRRASAPDAHESRTVALTIERRRLAAKGGA